MKDLGQGEDKSHRYNQQCEKNEMVLGRAYQPPQRRPMDLACHHLGDHMTGKDVRGNQPSGGETTWTNTGATRYGRGQHKTGSFGDGMLRPSPNHGIIRLPNDDDDVLVVEISCGHVNTVRRFAGILGM